MTGNLLKHKDPDGKHGDNQGYSGHKNEFIHIRHNTKRGSTYGSRKQNKVYINSNAASPNDQDWHGGEVNAEQEYGLRIDCVFTDNFRKKLGIDKLSNTNAPIDKDHYTIIKGLIDPDWCKTLYNYVRLNARRCEMKQQHDKEKYREAWDGTFTDKQCPGNYAQYGDPLMDSMLMMHGKQIEIVTGMQLAPSHLL